MHRVAAAVGAWLGAGDDAVIVRAPLVADDEPAAVAALGRLGPGDAIVVLSHDPAVDTPVLAAALRATVGYVGALGSRRTQASRRERLLAARETADGLDAIHGPAGLDLGATTAAEIALSICAEILATRAGRAPLSLRDAPGPGPIPH